MLILIKVVVIHISAILLKKFGRNDEAIDCYNKLILINPNDANAYFQRGFLLMEKDKIASL